MVEVAAAAMFVGIDCRAGFDMLPDKTLQGLAGCVSNDLGPHLIGLAVPYADYGRPTAPRPAPASASSLRFDRLMFSRLPPI